MISFLCIVFVHIFESGLLIYLDFVHFVPPVGHGVRAKYGEADDRFDAKLISSAGSVLTRLIGGFPIPGLFQKMASERLASGYQTFLVYADVGLITHPNSLLFLLYP